MHPGCTKKTLILTLGEEILQKIQISVIVDKIMTVSVKNRKKSGEISSKFSEKMTKNRQFWWKMPKFCKKFDEILLKFWDWSGASVQIV